MKRLLLLCMVQCLLLCMNAQTTVETALPLEEGTNSFTFESSAGQNTVYYVYTAPAGQSQLLTVRTEASSVNVMLSRDGTSNTRISGIIDGNGAVQLLPVGKGQKVYLSIAVYDQASVSFTASLEEADVEGGATCETALPATQDEFYVPSHYDSRNYQTHPTFLAYSCTEDGLLEMTFGSYLSSMQIRVGCEGAKETLSPVNAGSQYIARYAVEAGKHYIVELMCYSPLMASFKVSHPVEGLSCDLPFTGKSKDNRLPEVAGKYWYRCVADRDGFMLILSEDGLPGGNISIYKTCNDYTPHASIDGYFALRCKVDAEATYLVCIEKTEETVAGETFDVTMEDPEPGDSFDLPLTIETGTCTVPRYDGTYYYKLTVPAGDSRFLVVDARDAGLQSSNSGVKLFRSDNSYSPVNQGKDYVKSEVAAGASYVIAWSCGEGFNAFGFATSYEAIAQGDVCSNPLPAEKGENQLSAGSLKYYSYTPALDGWLSIETEMTVGVAFPRGCQGSGDYDAVKAGRITKTEVVSGTEYLIRFTGMEEATSFVLSEEAYQEGESCGMAIPAVAGANPLPDKVLNHWYVYTALQDGMVTIDSDLVFEQSPDYRKSSSVSVKAGDCSSYPVGIIQSNSEGTWFEGKFVVRKDDVLYVNVVTCSAQTGKNLNFAIRDLKPGEAVSLPLRLFPGKINLPESNRNLPVWYLIDLQPGELDIVSENSFAMSLYIEGEESTPVAQTQYGYDPESSTSEYKLHYAAETAGAYFLKLEMSYANTEVSVSGSAIVTGDECSVPLTAIKGQNMLEAGTVRYYSYTTTQEGWLTIDTDHDVGVAFPKDCREGGEYEAIKTGTVSKMKGIPGTEYLIEFTGVEESTRFVLDEVAYQAGELCSNAIPVTAGATVLPDESLNRWYVYTAPQDGMLTISSDLIPGQGVESASVSVKADGCSADPVEIIQTNRVGNWFEGRFIVQEGDALYIHVVTNPAQAGRNLTLAIRDFEPGETCFLPLNLASGVVVLPEADPKLPVWYVLDLQPGDLNLVSSDSFMMSLFKECGESTPLARTEESNDPESDVPGYILYYRVEAAGRYLLKLETSSAGTEVTVSGSAIASGIVNGEGGEVTVLAKNGAIVVVPGSGPVEVTLYDMAGRIVESRLSDSIVSLIVPKGFYLVKAGNRIYKVVVKH